MTQIPDRQLDRRYVQPARDGLCEISRQASAEARPDSGCYDLRWHSGDVIS